jgi:hypothetical protein
VVKRCDDVWSTFSLADVTRRYIMLAAERHLCFDTALINSFFPLPPVTTVHSTYCVTFDFVKDKGEAGIA